jgi:hypothetical protein
MDHPVQCPLCDQEDETVHHLLISCVFSRKVWFRIFSLVNLRQFSPTRADLVFQDWWTNLEAKVPHALRKGINSLVMLVAWWLWKQRSKCVFEGMLLVATRLYRTSKTTLRSGVSRVPKICAPSGLSLGTVLAVF